MSTTIRSAKADGLAPQTNRRGDSPGAEYDDWLRERCRRVLVYRHMHATAEQVHYGQVDSWPHQPTAEEVAEAVRDWHGGRDATVPARAVATSVPEEDDDDGD